MLLNFREMTIDAKFPGDTYNALQEAYEDGDKLRIEECVKNLLRTIQNEAKDISTKYIEPPYTTEFAIMFLPFEGLYSEVVNRGMVEKLQREYKVNIAGPSTMAALLNSLQMGFKTLAVKYGMFFQLLKQNLITLRKFLKRQRVDLKVPIRNWILL